MTVAEGEKASAAALGAAAAATLTGKFKNGKSRLFVVYFGQRIPYLNFKYFIKERLAFAINHF